MYYKWLFVIFFLLHFISCNTVEPPLSPVIDNKPKTANSIKISVDYSTLSSINLKITKSTFDTLNSFNYKLKRNENLISEFSLLASDTTFLDDNNGQGFQQGTVLTYKTEAYKDTSVIPADTSNILIAEVLKTTSHDIIWQVDTIGNDGSSLTNVWALDENNIWAVGYLDFDSIRTNIIKWDGQKWIAFPSSGGAIKTIWGFNEYDIWVGGIATNRGFVAHWNGFNWKVYKSEDYFNANGYEIFQINAIWGSSSNDVWAVGNEGTIIRWNGSEWNKVESPLPGSLSDVWGTSPNSVYINQKSGAVQGQRAEIVKFNGSIWEDITAQFPSGPQNLGSFWVDKTGQGYAVGNETYYYDGLKFKSTYVGQLTYFFTVRGLSINEIFISGQQGFIYHYNGDTWTHYLFLNSYHDWLDIKGIALLKNKFVFAASTLNKGVIITGKR